MILLTCKKLLSTHLVNTYSSKTLGTLLILNYLYWEYLFICYIRYHFLLCCKKVGIQKYWLSSEDMKSQVCCTSIIVLYNNISVFTMFLTQGQGYGKPPQGASKLGKKKETRQKCQEAVKHALLFFLYKSWCCILILSFFFKNKENNIIYNNKLRPVVHWTILLMKSRSNCSLAHCCFCILNWIVKQFARFVHTWNC